MEAFLQHTYTLTHSHTCVKPDENSSLVCQPATRLNQVSYHTQVLYLHELPPDVQEWMGKQQAMV